MRYLSFKIIFAFCVLNFTLICYAQPPRYEIDAKLDAQKHKIIARQKVTFTNNTDKEVKEIYFHIYPHRKYTREEIRFIYRYAGYFKINLFPEGFQSGDLRINSIYLNQGEKLNYAIEGRDETILKVNLGSWLKPNDKTELVMDFEVDIPHALGRFGWHKDITTLARWYPILSVLDEEGWHNYPFYIYHQPYFSQAAYYQVNLTLAKEAVVAASGVIKGEAANNDGTKILKLETEFPVRDFGLSISPDFNVYSLKEGKVKINSYYLTGSQARAKEAAQSAASLMRFYSDKFGEYPYSEFNIAPSFLAYGGCQSSGLIFIDTRAYKLPGFLKRHFDFLIAHETGHQWFYNLIGSDEYKEMFLDEGMNSYWILQYLENKYGPAAKVMLVPKFLKWLIPDFSFRDAFLNRYVYLAKNGLDGPVIGELSSFQEPSSIFALTYGKGAGVIEMLSNLIGREKFMRIMRRYSEEFRFKNLKLNDFVRICNEESGRDLSWFFGQWLKTDKSCDYAVQEVSKDRIVLSNRGSAEMPVKVRVVYRDQTEGLEYWDGRGRSKIINIKNASPVKQVELDPDNQITFDLDRANNYWPRHLYLKTVALYHGLYEIPVFLPRSSYNLVLGPSAGGSSLGLASSLQRPDDNILRLLSNYDFNDEALETTLGYEIKHLFNKQVVLGFEFFNRESNAPENDVTGGKIYLRKELWPSSYGLFDLNDHITFYLLRDRKLDKTATGINGKEGISNYYYRRKDEAIFGITGSLGRYGPYGDPVYGWKFIPTQEFAGHFLGGNDSFWRSSLELDNYYLLLPKQQHKLASRIKLGWGESSDKKLFQLGGPDGLRGYSRKTIEGAHMLLGSIEYRLPLKSDIKFYLLDNIIGLDTIQLVGFFDSGKAWAGDFRGDSYRKDAGLGLRFHLDLFSFLEKAVVRVDIAQALGDSKEGAHVWFGLSQSF